MSEKPPVELAFSQKYDDAHSRRYLAKHRDGLARRLSNWRDQRMARNALRAAGDPLVVLDLPCGAGRFWQMLAEKPGREILAADNSPSMIEVATRSQPPAVVARVRAFQSSAFAIDLPDESVDCVFCMRLMHHVADPRHRLALLREFRRVTRQTLIVSLWVDGNLQAWRRRRLEARRARQGRTARNANRFVVERATIEREFAQAGFRIVAREDLLRAYSMWRVYTLKKEAPAA
ncbi:MAG: class I SAM-dependent methyltransferase [Burkholderiales bacterium]|nr:class I SAM-dependent methyltransferase [Burkholderiales bacterium]